MKKINALLGLSLLAALAACSGDEAVNKFDPKLITSNDFESVAGWGVDPTMLERGRAHSGRYALKADATHEYSLGYSTLLGQASPTKIKTLHLEAWAFLPSQRSGGILGVQVMSVADPSKEAGSGGIKLGEVVKTYNKWVQVSTDFTLPADVTAAQVLRMALWRGSGEEVLVDDVVLSIKE